jgi:hypothetical protein
VLNVGAPSQDDMKRMWAEAQNATFKDDYPVDIYEAWVQWSEKSFPLDEEGYPDLSDGAG